MDKIIDARFDRVEKALVNLIASISKYSPAPALAQDLVLADQELNDGLSLLNQHQQNTHTLDTLHATSAALDTQIRDFLILLTSTRIEYEELLSYARRISKYTAPPETRSSKPEASSPKQEEIATNGSTTPSVTVTGNGANGNAMDTDVPSVTPNGSNPPAPSQDQASQQPSQSQTALDAEVVQALNTRLDDRPFQPWARDEDIRGGALANIQALLDSGIDPEGWDPELEEQKKREKAEELEREKEAQRVQEEERHRADMERRNNAMSAGAGAGVGAERPKVFQLDEFDDDDD
ncbi:mediator of rna polymerase ii transcription subunit 4 [Botrytis cinerea]